MNKNTINKFAQNIISYKYLLILLIASLIYCALIFSPPGVGVGGDFISFHQFRVDFLKKGILEYKQFPLWDPYRFSGNPRVGDPQGFIFYIFTPFMLIFSILFNSVVALKLTEFIHIFLAGFFMYKFVLYIQRDKSVALLSAIAYILGGAISQKVAGGYPQRLFGLAWAPLILMLTMKGFDKGFKHIILAGIILAIQLLSGGVIPFYYTGIFIIYILIFYIFNSLFSLPQKSKYVEKILYFLKSFLKLVLKVVSSYSICALLAAIKVLPMWEFLSISYRSNAFSLEDAYHHYVHNLYIFLSCLFGREFLQSFMNPFTHAQYNLIEYSAYIGVVAILLIVASIFIERKNKYMWLFLGSFVFFSMISFGPKSPINIYAFLYRYFPFFKGMHGGVRALEMVNISGIVLLGLGFKGVSNRIKTQCNRNIFFLSVLVFLILDLGSFSLLSVNANARRALVVPGKIFTSKKPDDTGAVLLKYPTKIYNSPSAERIPLKFIMKNIGNTLWLTKYSQKKYKGVVYLSVAIFDKDQMITEEILMIPKNIFPGEQTIVQGYIDSPKKSGNYALKVRLYDRKIRYLSDIQQIGEIIVSEKNEALVIQDSEEPLVVTNNVRIASSFLLDELRPWQVRIYPFYMWHFPNGYLLENEYHSAWGIEAGTWLAYYNDYLKAVFSEEPGNIPWGELSSLSATAAKLLGIINVKYIIPINPSEFSASDIIIPIKNVPYIYENKKVLPRIFFVRNGILVLGNKSKDMDFFTDIIKLSRFEPHNTVLIRDQSSYLDDFSLSYLDNFIAIIISKYFFKDFEKAKDLLKKYEERGGKVFYDYGIDKDRIREISKEIKLCPLSGLDNFIKDKERGFQCGKITKFSMNYREANLLIKEPGFIIFNEVYAPGWKLKVNNISYPLHISNGLLLGAHFDKPGRHKIKFYYLPNSFLWGMSISIFALIFLPFIYKKTK